MWCWVMVRGTQPTTHHPPQTTTPNQPHSLLPHTSAQSLVFVLLNTCSIVCCNIWTSASCFLALTPTSSRAAETM